MDVNERPISVNLSASSVAENEEAIAIGDLSTEDPDANESFSYTLLNETNLFEIVEGTLRTKGPLDFELASSYSLSVQAIDHGGLSVIEQLLITVSDVEEVVLGQKPVLKLNVFPNPATDYISITGDVSFERIKCYDLSGVEILESDTGQLDVSGLSNGIYLLRIYTGGQIISTKFIKN